MRFLGLCLAALIALTAPSAHAQMVFHQTGTTYTFQNADCDQSGIKAITFSNSAGVAVTLPQAGANNQFLGGCTIQATNIGSGSVTITPVTSTINGSASLTLTTGQSVRIVNDANLAVTGNYFALLGAGSGGGSSVTWPTPTQIVVSNGTNSPTSVAIGTSGATVPLLNGTNTWGNPQTFNGISSSTGAFTTLGAASLNVTGTGTSTIGSAITFDYSQGAADTRWSYINNTLALTQSTSNIWEQDNSFLTLSGNGFTASGEINVMHAYFATVAGVTSTQAEGVEVSNLINGTQGTFDSFLSTVVNGETGTTGSINGIVFNYQNNNTTAGSIVNYSAIQCNPMSGAGSAPTFDYCIRNTDTGSTIATLGNVVIGSLTPPGTSTLFEIKGPDTSPSTVPLAITNSAGTTLIFDDTGTLTLPIGAIKLGTSGNWGKINFGNTTSGSLQLNAPSSGALSGTVTLPNATTTLAGLAVPETFTAAQTFSSTITATGLSAGTQVSCLGLSSGNAIVTAACSSGGGGYGGVYGISPSSTANPAAGGTGNAVGDKLTLADSCTTNGVLTVTSVTTGAVTGYTIANPGSCTAIPSDPVAVGSTTGSGSGATFTLTYGGLAAGLLAPSSNQANLYLWTSPNAGLYGSGNLFEGSTAGINFTGNSDANIAIGDLSCGGLSGATFTATAMMCWGNEAGSNIANGAARDILMGETITSAISGTDDLIFTTEANITVTSGSSLILMQGGGSITSGSSQVVIGKGCGDTDDTTGSNVILLGTSAACDVPSTGTSNYIGIFGSTSPIISVTGTNVATTSITKFAGTTVNAELATFDGHIAGAGSPPSIAVGTATLDSNASDLSGSVTEGTAQTGFTLLFGITYTTVPHCVVTSLMATALAYTLSATTLTVSNASATGDVFDYVCAK